MGTTGQVVGALNIRQVAELENVTCARVRQWIRDDRYNIHAVKVGGQCYIPEDVYKEFKQQDMPRRRSKSIVEPQRTENKNAVKKQMSDPWESLAHAIVKSVVQDYRSAWKSGNKAKILQHKRELQSDWIRFLLGGLDVDYLLNKIDRMTK